MKKKNYDIKITKSDTFGEMYRRYEFDNAFSIQMDYTDVFQLQKDNIIIVNYALHPFSCIFNVKRNQPVFAYMVTPTDQFKEYVSKHSIDYYIEVKVYNLVEGGRIRKEIVLHISERDYVKMKLIDIIS